ncbi:MAG: hypothetical protein Q7S26_02575 [bacterium]|nr:hypothetical protein [bacterium]
MKKILVVVHDAGAGEVIAAYVRTHRTGTHYYIYAAGLAAKILKRNHLVVSAVRDSHAYVREIVQKHADASLVLVGTGWMTTIETTAILEAKKLGLKTVVYLDSWGDYRTRFGYPHKSWRAYLPDELWCGDKHALTLARKYFPSIRVRLVPNEYEAEAIRRTRALRRKTKQSYVLFLNRPNVRSDKLARELAVELSKRKDLSPLHIRHHPAEKIKTRTVDIAQDLAGARAVVGQESAAMAISVAAGIPTIRIIERGVSKLLPHKGIVQVHSVKAVAKLIS